MRFVDTMGYRVFSDELSKIRYFGEPVVINTISPISYGIATKDIAFKNALINSEYLVLDGVYFALSAILLHARIIKKNQGPEVFSFFMKKMNAESGKVFFLGSTTDVLKRIKDRSFIEFPNIKLASYSPPFSEEFSFLENEKIIKEINAFKPDVLFVGMTCPKQEKWVEQNRGALDVKFICSIGAVFDWFAGTQKTIKPIWWKLRLGWLKRAIDRPEIFKRYPYIGIFFSHLLYALLRIKKYK